MEPRGSIEHQAALAAVTLALASQRVGSKLFPGDTVSFTAGKETFYPGREVGFEVGPITVQTTVGPGEDTSSAYVRAVETAYVMFEAEFAQKRVGYFKRLEELSK